MWRRSVALQVPEWIFLVLLPHATTTFCCAILRDRSSSKRIPDSPAVHIRRDVLDALPTPHRLSVSCLTKTTYHFQTSWCNNLEDHQVQLFHSLALPGNGISSSDGTAPCRQFLLTPLPGTNAYLLVVRSRVMYGCNENAASVGRIKNRKKLWILSSDWSVGGEACIMKVHSTRDHIFASRKTCNNSRVLCRGNTEIIS